MGIMHKNSASSGVVNPGASAETVVYTTPVMAIGPVGPNVIPIDVSGTLYLTPGTGTTAVVIRCRQGSLTGPLIGPAITHTLAAGASGAISYGFTDTSTFLEQTGGGVYVITAQQTGGTGAGTTNGIDIKVMTLWLLLASWAWLRLSRPILARLAPSSPVPPRCGPLSGSASRLLFSSLSIWLSLGGLQGERVPVPLAILGCRGIRRIHRQLGLHALLWREGATGLMRVHVIWVLLAAGAVWFFMRGK